MLSNSIKYSYLSNKIIIYIEEKFNSKIDKRSLDYARFLSHVRFTIERVLTDTVLKNDLTEIIKKSYPISYEIAEGASKIIEETLDKKVCDDEVGSSDVKELTSVDENLYPESVGSQVDDVLEQ